jgi:hypothetical protein
MAFLDCAKIAPNINSFVSQLLSDHPEGVEIDKLHDLYVRHRPHDCPALDHFHFLLMVGYCMGAFQSFTRISFDPLIISLVKPQ